MGGKSYLLLILHAHLPFVRRPDLKAALEEDWLFEALTETYLPLLEMFERLQKEGVPFRITVSLSPTLLHMLRDPMLMARYVDHMRRSIALAASEADRLSGDIELGPVAAMYRDWFIQADDMFRNGLGGDVVSAFARLAGEGVISLITTAATHAYLPLISVNPEAAIAQVKIAAAYFKKTFGAPPAGFWLPECGYEPGVEKILAQEGIGYFFVDAHGVLGAKPAPPAGTMAPILVEPGVAVFGRDLESSRQIWNPDSGYPGHPSYRDFYRDQGYELDMALLADYLAPYGHRKMTGLKYHKITGGAGEKDAYNIQAGQDLAREHALDFYQSRLRRAQAANIAADAPPMFVAPFDAELFGHWWHEGMVFLEALIRKAAGEDSGLRLITAEDYLKLHPDIHKARPAASSWGLGGHSEMWLDGSNDWIYRHLHKAADRMRQLAQRYQGASPNDKRALDQAARELMLAQSSDWPFMMKTGAMSGYATRRVEEHLANFNRLRDEIISGRVDLEYLGKLEQANNIFPQSDFTCYSGSS
jgi:1,4-alpha-glucan branching enzyme